MSEEVTAGLATPEEKSRAIFECVKNEYKTTTEYYGWGFYHDKITQLLDDKIGAGEGKNVLLAKMHTALDILSWLVLISTRDNGEFKPRFSDTRQFNYLVTFVQIGDSWEFLDAANRLAPYGLLPPSCLTTGGFLIDGDESDLVRMAIKPVTSFRSDSSIVRIASDGSVTCRSDCKFAGYCAASYGERYEKSDPEEFYEDYFTKRLAASCDIVEKSCGLDSLNQFEISIEFTTDDMVRRLENILFIEPVQFAFRSPVFESAKRHFPVDFQYPFVYKNTAEVLVEGGATEMVPPVDTAFSINGASFQRRSAVTDSSVIVSSMLQIDDVVFKPSRYRKLKNLFEKIALAGKDEILFVTDNP